MNDISLQWLSVKNMSNHYKLLFHLNMKPNLTRHQPWHLFSYEQDNISLKYILNSAWKPSKLQKEHFKMKDG